MPIAPHMFPPDEPFEDMKEDLLFIVLALLACKLTETLAPEIEQLLTDMSPVRVKQESLERELSGWDAKIPFADDVLNIVLDDAKKAVPAQLKNPLAKDIMEKLFQEYDPSELRRYTLGEQLEIQRGWEDTLKPLGNTVLSAIGARSTAAAKYADGVLAKKKEAQTALDQFLATTRADYVANCNTKRAGIFGKVLAIYEDPANAPLPDEFVERFFLRDTSGRVVRLADLDKMIERLEKKLEKVKKRREELKKKLDDAAKEKLKSKLDKKKKKLDKKKKGLDDETAEIAAMEAELAKLEGG